MTQNGHGMFVQDLYYLLRPLIPKHIRIALRRSMVARKRSESAHVWPIDERAATAPGGWSGWPGGKQFGLVLTHDVETARGIKNVGRLMEMEKSLGFCSSYNFVAQDYSLSSDLREKLMRNGFEVGMHGLKHRGNLFRSRRSFARKVPEINRCLREWGIVGFRAPSMFRNLEWIGELEIEYDSSTFDTDPFEAQPEGVCTIFPFWVHGASGRRGYVEMPYTLPQDFTLFILMKERNIDIWKRKLDWIAEKGGMALIDTHPDYMDFEGGKRHEGAYPWSYYEQFLNYVKNNYRDQFWHVLPREVASFCRGKGPQKSESNNLQRKSPLRVCMLTYSFYESDGRVMRYAEALAERGDDVDVIALRKGGLPAFEVLRKVKVHRIQSRKIDEASKFSYLYRLVRFLLFSGAILTRKHSQTPYRLVHVHSVPDFEVFAATIPKLRGAKVILDLHDIVPEFYGSKFRKSSGSFIFNVLVMVERLSIRMSDHVIISNHLWRDKICSRSVGQSKCSVFLNYPDPALFHPRMVKKEGGAKIIYPGSLIWHQGLDIAIRAFAKIKDQIPGAVFHIYGKGGEKENLLSLISGLGIHERVVIGENLPIEVVAERMAEADFAVVPKRNDLFGGEAFSTKILEFMAIGVPVIVSKTKIDQYYFNDSVVQFFKPEHVDDLARCMLEFANNRDRREALAANAAKFVKQYTWDKKKEDYLNLVDMLVETSN